MISATYLLSLIKLAMSDSNFINIILSFWFLFSVDLINSSRSIPVESVYVSVLESAIQSDKMKYMSNGKELMTYKFTSKR